ncbi:MAG: MotA/TolQ/ExbB proton channel family protein [Chlamydiales bacterium]|nr:MotA/TolQ/ExbB proton channel family protein [Chlamydiales bacterium]
MIVCGNLLAVNPFVQAYTQSDLLGKAIFLGLIALSVVTWVVLIFKVRLTKKALRLSKEFELAFVNQKHSPLNFEYEELANPYLNLYLKLKGYAVDILKKNQKFGFQSESGSYLSPQDIDLVGAHLMSAISSETKFLERYLYLLATIVTLAPFLGLLGTVWGILVTFAEPQLMSSAGGSGAVLGGISLALVTTVLGLLNAIPALIGYNYLKDLISEFETAMEEFSCDVLSSLELQYRRVDKV